MAQCVVAGSTKVDTPEGSVAVQKLVGKPTPVLTRTADGHHRFQMLQSVRKVEEQQPVLRVTLENGQAFLVGREQVLFSKEMEPVRAEAVQSGTLLMAAHQYREGYEYFDTVQGITRTALGGVAVASVIEDGTADLYAVQIAQTGTCFLAAGVLCQGELCAE